MTATPERTSIPSSSDAAGVDEPAPARGDAENAFLVVLTRVDTLLKHGPELTAGRQIVATLATAFQSALLISRADDTGSDADRIVAEAFVRTRIDHAPTGHVFGSVAGPELAAAADVLLDRYSLVS